MIHYAIIFGVGADLKNKKYWAEIAALIVYGIRFYKDFFQPDYFMFDGHMEFFLFTLLGARLGEKLPTARCKFTVATDRHLVRYAKHRGFFPHYYSCCLSDKMSGQTLVSDIQRRAIQEAENHCHLLMYADDQKKTQKQYHDNKN